MSETVETTSPVQSGEISRLTDHLFRQEAGKLVSILTGVFGINRLQLAEDVVQEALIRALQTWPYYGIPRNPAAWLTQTARNLALDVLRREKLFHEKQPAIIAYVEQWPTGEDEPSAAFDHEIKDHSLRLMFACCHPQLPQEAQTALALKTLCGFDTGEIAAAFLTSEAAIAKRLTRAKQSIRDLQIPFEIPSGEAAADRLEGVMQTLYLLFNEGYKASTGESLIREELCREAIRLVTLLVNHPIGNRPRVHALAALMQLNAARLPARVDTDGNILRLKDQDRSRWDRSMIMRGMFHLAQSAAGNELSDYHIQAAIAACHCLAADYASTDWSRILALYDQLIQIDRSPVVALNRAVAVAQVHGPKVGMEAIKAMPNQQSLEAYYLLYAVMAEFEFQLGEFKNAADHLQQALKLADLKSERSLLLQKLQDCELQLQGASNS